jgi:hypothetical protein
MPPLMLEQRYPNYVRFLAVNHHVWEILEPDSPEDLALEVERKLTRRGLDRSQARPKLSFEPFREMRATFRLVVVQSLVEILLN